MLNDLKNEECTMSNEQCKGSCILKNGQLHFLPIISWLHPNFFI